MLVCVPPVCNFRASRLASIGVAPEAHPRDFPSQAIDNDIPTWIAGNAFVARGLMKRHVLFGVTAETVGRQMPRIWPMVSFRKADKKPARKRNRRHFRTALASPNKLDRLCLRGPNGVRDEFILVAAAPEPLQDGETPDAHLEAHIETGTAARPHRRWRHYNGLLPVFFNGTGCVYRKPYPS
jgi:hypothetical protein